MLVSNLWTLMTVGEFTIWVTLKCHTWGVTDGKLFFEA
jgi:hypothetical protein